MYYVYAIRSITKNWIYIGNTKNVETRFVEHNKGFVKSTKYYRPFTLIFVQIVVTRREARDLEEFLKVRWNKEGLLDLLTE